VSGSAARPFYGRFAWAYDLLSDRPVAEECDHIATIFADRGLPPDARVLDAGCGTGRYAVELAHRGFRVTGLDASDDLLTVARRRRGAADVVLVLADLTSPPPGPRHDAILCRGVLNDVVDDRLRREVFLAFARVLERGGALVLDVREWEATVSRKSREPVHEKTVETPHGTLAYRSETRLDHGSRALRIAEHHRLTNGVRTTTADYDFVMRCWTRDELDGRLAAAGFVQAEYRGSYDRAVPVGATDRLVAVATRS
jgi:SAM-dependent methyltransferase